MIEKIISPLIGALSMQLKFKGDRQELRRVIRQRIIAPHVDRLHIPSVRHEVARDILTAAFATKTMSLMQSLSYSLIAMTLFPAKISLIKSILARQVNHLRANVVIKEDHEELTFRVVKGKSALKRLVRDILAIL